MLGHHATTPALSDISRRLFESLTYPAWVVEGYHRRIVAVNAAAVDFYGVDPTTFLSLYLGDEGPSPACPRPLPVPDDVRSSIQGHLDRHGDRLWVEIVELPPEIDTDDGAQRLVWARDATDRHVADDRLRLLEAAVDVAREVIIVTSSAGAKDRDPIVVHANRALEHATGWPVHALIGNTLGQLVHPDTDRQSLDMICQALADKTAIVLEVLVRHRSGAGRWMEVSLSPHGDMDGDACHCVWTLCDVTQRRRLQDQLVHATSMDAVGRVAESLTHDLNNLLTIVASSTQLAQGRMPADHVLTGYLQEIQMATDRAHALTGQLLAVGRKGGQHPQVLNPATAVQDLLPLLRRLVGPDVELELALPAPAHPVRADPTHIEQMLLNLVANARDAMPHGGRVRISVTRAGDEVLIAVCDTGHGMDALTLERATEAFFTTKARGSGTGLGLSAVRMIAEQYGGRLKVTSKVGRGTTIIVALPVASADEGAPALRISSPPPAGRPVLLIEDEPSLRALLATALRGGGFDVHEDDGQDAYEALVAAGPYRLVVSDLHLGSRMACELLAVLREAQPEVPILCTTGYAPADAGLDTLTPPVDVLRKPFNLTQFAEAIQRTLTEAGRHPAP